MKKKFVYGIDEAGKCDVLGSLFYVLVWADEETLKRVCNKYDVKDSKRYKGIKKLKNTVEGCVDEGVMYEVYKYSAKDFKEGFNLNRMADKAVAELVISNVPYFWEAEIYIDSYQPRPEQLIGNVKKFLPERFEKMEFKNWVVEHRADTKYKIVSLASMFAKYFKIKEQTVNKTLYGIYESHPNNENVLKYLKKNLKEPTSIIRQNWTTFKKLKLTNSMKDWGKKIKEDKK